MSVRLRFLSFNIHGCVGRGGREDPEAVLAVIREADADVVALQEVHDDDEADRSFLRGLEALDYGSLHYGQTLRKSFGPYGNVLMCRRRLRAVRRLDISFETVEPRGALRGELLTEAGAVRVTATHLGLTWRERRAQVARLLEANAGGRQRLDVLLGDVNEWNPLSRNLRALRRAYPLCSTLRTYPARRPVFALDRVFFRGAVRWARFRRIDSAAGRWASDHRAVLAECELDVPEG